MAKHGWFRLRCCSVSERWIGVECPPAHRITLSHVHLKHIFKLYIVQLERYHSDNLVNTDGIYSEFSSFIFGELFTLTRPEGERRVMSRMLGSMIILAILFSMLYPSTIVHETKASTINQTIYIRADGSVDPSTAPIQRNGDVYTLTDDLSPQYRGTLFIIERNNMTLNGAGHSLSISAYPYSYSLAIGVEGMSNVTIMNLTITGFTSCISLTSCLNITLTGNILEPWWWEDGNDLEFDQFGRGGPAIDLAGTSNSTIVDNYITRGILFEPANASNYNHLFHNNFQFQPAYWRYSFEVSGNNSWDDGYPSGGNYWNWHTSPDVFSGPYQNESGSDGIVDTPVTASAGNVDHYSLVVPREPYAYGPAARFSVPPSVLLAREPVKFDASTSTPGWNGTQVILIREYRWDFGDGNVTSIFPPFSTVYPIIFHAYHDAGTFKPALTVIDQEGTNSSTSETVQVFMATVVSISTTSASSLVGYNLVISGRLCVNIWGDSLKDQTVVLSYIFSGAEDWVPITSAITDSLGGYQVVWIPTATGSFTVKATWTGNSTWFGATNSITYSSLAYGSQYVFTVESNSTVQELSFNATNRELSFTAAGSNGTQGYARVTVPRSLVGDSRSIKAYLDDAPTSFGITSNDDSYVLSLSYTHSTHTVTINLGSISTPLLDTPLGKLVALGIPITAIITVIIVYAVRKKHRNNQ
jgi:hypothetical protein